MDSPSIKKAVDKNNEEKMNESENMDLLSYLLTLNFDEPDNENNMLRDSDKQIKAASFAKIVSKMVDPTQFGIKYLLLKKIKILTIKDIKFVMDMLFTYRSFSTSFKLLGALIRR